MRAITPSAAPTRPGLTLNATLHARSFWLAEPGRGEIRSETLPAPGPDDVLVRALYSGISRGTETLVFTGAIPPAEFARMRAPFQAGDFPAPVKYGYSNVGVVEHGPAALRGRTVFCLYPHQTHFVVPATAVQPLPADVPPQRAVLAANLETAVNGLWDAAPRLGDRVAVVGAGAVGSLVAWLAANVVGCEVELIDVDPRKAAVARELRVAFKLPTEATRDADVVVHSSGSGAGLTTALELAGFEASVIEMSWYGTHKPQVPLGEAFHSRRLSIKSSQVGSISPTQRMRWNTARRMQLVMRLLAAPELDALISGESPFADLPQVLTQLATAPGYTLCHRIAYS